MLFHFLSFSQRVCLGIKTSTKLQISKSTPKGEISIKKKSLFKNYNERLVWTTKLFSCINCDITIVKSRLLKFDWLADEENKPGAGVLYHCISDGNRLSLSTMLDVIFISSCI